MSRVTEPVDNVKVLLFTIGEFSGKVQVLTTDLLLPTAEQVVFISNPYTSF